jgi:predicted ATPase
MKYLQIGHFRRALNALTTFPSAHSGFLTRNRAVSYLRSESCGTKRALGEIVKAEAGIRESDDREDLAAKLEQTVAALFEDTSDRTWVATRLGPLVGCAGIAAASREETFTAWRRFLEAIAALRPCVLVVEDLHWADAALLEFLEHLLDWSMPVPLFLVCTARPELFERQPSWGGGKRNATTISLSPLTIEESGRLLQILLDRTLLPADTQTALLERAGGNPLYAEQLLECSRSEGTPSTSLCPRPFRPSSLRDSTLCDRS